MTFGTLLFGSLLSFIVEELLIVGVILPHALNGLLSRTFRARLLPRSVISAITAFYFFALVIIVILFTRVGLLEELNGGTRLARFFATVGFCFVLDVLWFYDNWQTIKAIEIQGDSSDVLRHVRELTLTPLARIGIKRSSAVEEFSRRSVQLTGILAVIAFVVLLERTL